MIGQLNKIRNSSNDPTCLEIARDVITKRNLLFVFLRLWMWIGIRRPVAEYLRFGSVLWFGRMSEKINLPMIHLADPFQVTSYRNRSNVFYGHPNAVLTKRFLIHRNVEIVFANKNVHLKWFACRKGRNGITFHV